MRRACLLVFAVALLPGFMLIKGRGSVSTPPSPISHVALTSGTDNTNVSNPSSYTTASVTCNANRLCLLSVVGRHDAVGAASEPIIGGTLTATWVFVESCFTESDNRTHLFVFRTMVGSNQTGTITITPASGQGWNNAGWSVSEFNNVDTSGTNGSGAVRQSTSRKLTIAATSLTVTLASFGSATNRAYLASGNRVNVADDFAPGTNFAQIHEETFEATRVYSQWAESVLDVTADFTWQTSDIDVCASALELVNG